MWFFHCFNFERNYDVFKSKNPCILLNKNIKSNKNKQELKMENPHTVLERLTLCFSWYKNRQLKKNCDEMELAKEKRGHFLYCLFCPKEIFFEFVSTLFVCKVYWIHFQNIHTFAYQKTLLHALLLLVFKIAESLQCILKIIFF